MTAKYLDGHLDNGHTRDRLARALSDVTSLRDYIDEAADGGITLNGVPQYRARRGTWSDLATIERALRRAYKREAGR